MPRINADQRAALGYWWNLVTDAAQSGFSVSETSAIAKSIADEQGRTLPFSEYKAIAQLYGYAKRIDNASAVFQNAGKDATITPDMIATPPYARDAAEQSSYPLYHVKFYYTYLDSSGTEQTAIRTSAQPMQLAATVGGIYDDVEVDAAGFAAKYGHQLVSAIPFEILEV